MTKTKKEPDNRAAVPDSRWRRMCRRIDWALVSLLLGIAAFHVATMPSMFYPGDNFAPRIEAAHWLETGRIAMPFAMKKQFSGFFDTRGQYFFEDDAKEVFYSKYGIGCTLAYLVPTLVERLHTGTANPMRATRSTMLFINIWQVLITLGIAIYFYLAIGLYTSRKWLRVTLLILAFYTTYVWHYLRAPTLEIYQMMPFLAAFYHMTRYLRSHAQDTELAARWIHLAAAMSYSCVLVWLKPFFAVNCIVMAFFGATAGKGGMKLGRRIMHNARVYWRQLLLALVLPGIVFASVVLFCNAYKFGNPLSTGYEQWEYSKDGWLHGFHFKHIPAALKGYLCSRMSFNTNAFIHYPLLVPALLALPLFLKRHGRESRMLLSLVAANLLALCTFKAWSGEWCYGPRYLINIMLLLTLPLVTLAEWIAHGRRLWPKLVLPATLTPVLIWSLTMQINMNSLHYFTFYYVRPVFANFKQERIDARFGTYFHRGQLNADLIAHRRRKAVFPPLKALSDMIAPQHKNIVQQLDQFLLNQASWNYYFAEDQR